MTVTSIEKLEGPTSLFTSIFNVSGIDRNVIFVRITHKRWSYAMVTLGPNVYV